ncbi:hypothetical protein [Arthrobacter methylotrophus]|uniref:Uncharacterized protein n=1 Tax=Arthrobacter methylotrophus TaxID=121291 RepID=A0ABV5UNF2_9MICC
MPERIITPGGYICDVPDVTGHPDVVIALPYSEAYDAILDGITSTASIEPITEPTFKLLAQDLLDLLIDASNGTDEDENFLD